MKRSIKDMTEVSNDREEFIASLSCDVYVKSEIADMFWFVWNGNKLVIDYSAPVRVHQALANHKMIVDLPLAEAILVAALVEKGCGMPEYAYIAPPAVWTFGEQLDYVLYGKLSNRFHDYIVSSRFARKIWKFWRASLSVFFTAFNTLGSEVLSRLSFLCPWDSWDFFLQLSAKREKFTVALSEIVLKEERKESWALRLKDWSRLVRLDVVKLVSEFRTECGMNKDIAMSFGMSKGLALYRSHIGLNLLNYRKYAEMLPLGSMVLKQPQYFDSTISVASDLSLFDLSGGGSFREISDLIVYYYRYYSEFCHTAVPRKTQSGSRMKEIDLETLTPLQESIDTMLGSGRSVFKAPGFEAYLFQAGIDDDRFLTSSSGLIRVEKNVHVFFQCLCEVQAINVTRALPMGVVADGMITGNAVMRMRTKIPCGKGDSFAAARGVMSGSELINPRRFHHYVVALGNTGMYWLNITVKYYDDLRYEADESSRLIDKNVTFSLPLYVMKEYGTSIECPSMFAMTGYLNESGIAYSECGRKRIRKSREDMAKAFGRQEKFIDPLGQYLVGDEMERPESLWTYDNDVEDVFEMQKEGVTCTRQSETMKRMRRTRYVNYDLEADFVSEDIEWESLREKFSTYDWWRFVHTTSQSSSSDEAVEVIEM